MRTDLFDFDLPADSIALRPASPRDSARMLVVQPDGVLRDHIVADLPKWLEAGDQLVVNDTKVISAQLRGRRIGRDTEPKIEATLIKRLDGSRWQALVKPAKKLAVAATTAGLHFTPALETALRNHGVGLHRITLHVGAGTFLPVKAEDTDSHRMHSEWGCISAKTAAALNAAHAAGGRIVAVGTTSLRLLESAAAEDGTIAPFVDETAIFITPGYRFRAVDILLTNFHLPRSTLFMLVSAFSGLEIMKRAYGHAISRGYRFYSYGDACLLFRDKPTR